MKEKSVGAVIYRVAEDGKRLYLVQRMNLGHYSICKGHVEGDETEVETATREIREETGLEVAINTNFRHVITYSPTPGVMKDVVFFVARYSGDQIPADNHDDEVKFQSWFPLGQALQLITHESDRETVILADQYLQSQEK